MPKFKVYKRNDILEIHKVGTIHVLPISADVVDLSDRKDTLNMVRHFKGYAWCHIDVADFKLEPEKSELLWTHTIK